MEDFASMGASANSKDYFTGLARGYDRHRPGYAPGAIDAMLLGLDPPVRAVSVGCGTGICCRLLAAKGVQTIGIDSNEDMLAEARRQSEEMAGNIVYRRGTGEGTGLP
ncbi:MAG: class I SAM-dependent methyltransferase, partial [Phycisphaerales bacterium]